MQQLMDPALHTATVGNAALTTSLEGITPTEGQPSGNVLVAHFTSASATAAAGEYAASIMWGDGSSNSLAMLWRCHGLKLLPVLI